MSDDLLGSFLGVFPIYKMNPNDIIKFFNYYYSIRMGKLSYADDPYFIEEIIDMEFDDRLKRKIEEGDSCAFWYEEKGVSTSAFLIIKSNLTKIIEVMKIAEMVGE